MNTVFLVGSSYGKAPNVYSNFEDAEKKILDEILKSIITLNGCGFTYAITSVVVDRQWKEKIEYEGSIKLVNSKRIVEINRGYSRYAEEGKIFFSFPIQFTEIKEDQNEDSNK